MTAALQDITEQSLQEIQKAFSAGFFNTTTGAYSYDLTGVVRLIPVVTPFRDKIGRKGSTDGSPFAIWRAFMNINNQQPSPFPGFDKAGNEVSFSEQDFQAQYRPIALAGLVTQDSVDLAKGLMDPYAEATMQVLNQVLIGEEKSLVGAQSFALPQPAAMTATAANTGGSLAASSTQGVAVAARTAFGYYYSGNSRGRASGLALTTTGTAGSIAASIPAVKGAVAYDWFYTSNGGTNWWYYGTTTVSSILIVNTIAANATPAASNLLPDFSTWAPTLNQAADNGSANPDAFDGFLASLTGDYNAAGQFVTPGTGTANGAVFIDGGGAALTLAGGQIGQIEQLFQGLWNGPKVSPTALMMNGAQVQEIANLILANPSAVTYLNTDEAGRVDVTAGGRVGHIVNSYANTVVPIEVEVAVPPGTIAARSDRVPFPQANISNVLEVRTLRDMSQFDYATGRQAGVNGGPRKEFEIRSVEAFVNRAPVAMGVLTNIL
ncbi:MAG TPA: hypothetical protein VGL39_27955 [Jatrophihabitantaceae bacterium]|jgi:hypothetical protein